MNYKWFPATYIYCTSACPKPNLTFLLHIWQMTDKAFFYMVASAIRKLVAKCVLEAQVFSALQNVSLMKAVAMVLN